MSRHRFVKDMVEDYYDDDDDYSDYDYEEEQYTEETQQYAPRESQLSSASNKPSAQKVTPKPATSSSSAGVTKPAPNAGVSKAPPGWEKPVPAPPPGGIYKPPEGWGKPVPTTPSSPAPAASAGGVSKPPTGWGKPTGATTPPRGNSPKRETAPTSSSKQQIKKPLPEVLKNARSQLSMVVLGHVDAGKSTLMGQLLVQIGQVSKRAAGKQQLAWLLDEDESERERGVTMQIATKSFSTVSHDIVILDAPGHADFIPIMITGAAHADVAILVVAATRGEFEAGFDNGQTKEHIILARGLGVTQVIVAVNKLDVDDWDMVRYQEIQQKLRQYLLQQQFAPKRIRFVPLSGLTGENVKQLQDVKLKAWYKGLTLLEAIDGFQPAKRQVGAWWS
jgi:small GTP-binding protein